MRCERVVAGADTVLIRVTLALGDVPLDDAASAQLVAADRGHVLRSRALPAPLPAGAATVTLGFAATATATPLGLRLGQRWIALPEADDALRDAELELRATRARLDVSRSARELAERQRDEALRAAARAEAAAHDANARAASSARSPRAKTAAHSPRATSPRAGQATPAMPAASRRSRRVAAAAGALGCAALLATVLAWPARDSDAVRGVGDVAAASTATSGSRVPTLAVQRLAARLKIPADYFALYREAARRYGLDWPRLAAIGSIESGHGRAPVDGILAGANLDGASGPAQFLPATWERFGLDGDGDGDRDPYNPADAIPAMASYLRASGAPQDWRAALRSYNHSDRYVTSVEALAASLRRDAT